MLEFFAVFSLCMLNRKNAIARGQRPGGFIALTIILWLVFETIGAIIGILIFGTENNLATVMFIALPCAALGGLISFLCAKFGPQGNYVDPSATKVAGPYYGNNGMPVYTNPNTAQIPLQQPAYTYDPNMVRSAPQPIMAQPVQPFAPAQPQPAPAAASGVRYCRYCGGANKPGNKFCESCGQNIE